MRRYSPRSVSPAASKVLYGCHADIKRSNSFNTISSLCLVVRAGGPKPKSGLLAMTSKAYAVATLIQEWQSSCSAGSSALANLHSVVTQLAALDESGSRGDQLTLQCDSFVELCSCVQKAYTVVASVKRAKEEACSALLSQVDLSSAVPCPPNPQVEGAHIRTEGRWPCEGLQPEEEAILLAACFHSLSSELKLMVQVMNSICLLTTAERLECYQTFWDLQPYVPDTMIKDVCELVGKGAVQELPQESEGNAGDLLLTQAQSHMLGA